MDDRFLHTLESQIYWWQWWDKEEDEATCMAKGSALHGSLPDERRLET